MKEKVYKFSIAFPPNWNNKIVDKLFKLEEIELLPPKIFFINRKEEEKFRKINLLLAEVSSTREIVERNISFFDWLKVKNEFECKELVNEFEKTFEEYKKVISRLREIRRKKLESFYSNDKKELEKIKSQEAKLKKKIRELQFSVIFAMEEALSDLARLFSFRYRVGRYGLVGYLVGYLPQSKKIEMKEKFSKDPVVIELYEDENAPIKLSNPMPIRSFEILTKLYGLPKKNEVDPTPFIFVFFPIFVGLTFADIGYSLLLLLLSLILIYSGKKMKRKGIKDLGIILLFSSFFGIMWGILFNSFFTYKILERTLLSLENPKVLLGLPLLIATVHLIVASTLGIRKDWKETILFNIPAILAIGLITINLLAGISINIPVFYLLVVPLLYSLWKNKIQFYSPFLEIFGRLLSYLRLTALALATNVVQIALFSIMALLGPLSIIGKGFAILFNFLLSVLSGFIHPLRLHFIEAFQFFYEGGGREMKKFGPTRRFVKDLKENYQLILRWIFSSTQMQS